MPRTELRALVAVAAAAFVLRAGVAVLTEHKPLFPAYYYTDATFADQQARAPGAALAAGYSLPQKTHILFTAALYRVFGPRPLAPKLANAVAAAFGVLALGLLAANSFGPRAGLASAGLLALWPSHVFYTAQNFKEGLVCGTLMGALLLLRPRAGTAAACGGLAALAMLGLLRAPAAAAAAASLAGAALLQRARGAGMRAAAAGALAGLFVLAGTLAAGWTPQRLSRLRADRFHSERAYAQARGREIGTLLFPEARFNGWLDLAAFAPKAAFYALFMPLPGLYPIEGKTARALAAAENLALLTLCLLGLAGAIRSGLGSGRPELLSFFVLMTAGAALLEFDLGGAGRHKLMYLPMLFPFAAELVLAPQSRRRT